MKQFNICIKQNDFLFQFIKLDIPDHDISLTDLMPALFKLFDCFIEIELKLTKTTCQKGCSVCCNQLIPISISEAFYLNDLIQNLPREKQTAVNKRFQSALHIMNKKRLFTRGNNPTVNKNIDQDYFNLKISCPFLESNICSIYEFRPFVCREYNLTSNPDFCIDPYHNSIEKIKIKRNIGALVAAFTARLYGLPPIPIPIPLILIPGWVKENKHLNNKTWSGEWLFNTIIDRLVILNDKSLELSYTVL
ncbi:MAG TPA: YkgJ family cysteine cluster protein [Methylomusa anaerophila]|uniref:Flagellin N-methylase n=1 Tax=Methylomusa anaerophila TaxID=1930071 RepID=A0A348AHH9_9FIRM|nr:YkgJ family cysteine cluster protein [Methylomusa anaerophila]BBB90527.1 flagellin N-methylase [Methylomusa anaerophila]HML89833.1 YkgJ family cysteine cluster protein [Methylomusa anaerophila]